MSKKTDWLEKHVSLGALVRHSGSLIGLVTKGVVKTTGAGIASFVSDPIAKKKINDISCNAGNVIDSTVKTASASVGVAVNKTVQVASVMSGRALGGVARACGASEENVVLAQKAGILASAVTIGAVAGAGIANAAAAIGAAAGTAGAAATTSGIAALGGGSIAAGGGGMAAGHAVMQGITTLAGVSGAASIKSTESSEEK